MSSRAVALNLMYDRRVCQARERSFLKILDRVMQDPMNAGKDGAELLSVVLGLYRSEFLSGQAIRDPHHPDNGASKRQPHFAVERENYRNLLNGDTNRSRPANGTLLANVLDLSGLDAVYRFARDNAGTDRASRKVFNDYPTRTEPRVIAEWLDGHLGAGTTAHERQTSFIRETLKALNRRREMVGLFQPVWATKWESLRQRIAGGRTESWLEANGLGRDDPRRWVVVLVYPVEAVQWLARPTQLDAGWYKYHFPSPPCVPAATGGHPMDLQTHPCPEKLLPEFVHEQTVYQYEHWDDPVRERLSNRLIGCTAERTFDALEVQRRNHYRLLVSSYRKISTKITQWMPSPC